LGSSHCDLRAKPKMSFLRHLFNAERQPIPQSLRAFEICPHPKLEGPKPLRPNHHPFFERKNLKGKAIRNS
jgi:hypothetical protein